MLDPVYTALAAGFIIAPILWLMYKWRVIIPGTLIYVLALFAISWSAGYPTNITFPSHAIVYGLTQEYVWAAPKDNPYPPRSFIFSAPPEWFEERDRRKGQPFEVEQQERGDVQLQGQQPADRDSGNGWVIVPSTLPPKDE